MAFRALQRRLGINWIPLNFILLLLLILCAASTMAGRFTAKDMLRAPRRGSAIPNGDGSKAITLQKIYSFSKHEFNKTVLLIDIETGDEKVLLDDNEISEATWIPDTTDHVTFLKSVKEPKGHTELWISNINNPKEAAKVASFPGPVSNLVFAKKPTSDGGHRFVVTGLAKPDGSLYNKESAPKKYGTAKVYTSLFARHWDSWIEEEKNAIFAGALYRNKDVEHNSKLRNVLKGSGLESPVAPFGGTGDFSLTPHGDYIAFVAKAPEQNPATTTATYLYIVPHSGDKEPVALNKASEKHTARGATSAPAFSPDGKQILFLQMAINGYESDRNRIYLTDLKGNIKPLLLDWDRSPSSLIWAKDGDRFYAVAEDHGRSKLWQSPSLSVLTGGKPSDKEMQSIVTSGSVSSVSVLADDSKHGELLLSSTSLVSPTFYGVYSSKGYKVINTPKLDNYKGISSKQVEEFWYDGAERKIHGFMIKPSNFDKSKTYPLAFFIHGGPQGAWSDAWSTRWNPLVFAEEGYVAVAINPTGSTSYGQELTDAIRGDWGGKPYIDLEKGYEYLLKEFSFIDPEKTVALGASYGGFMINWIQGHPLGRKFKALVCHNGVFSSMNQISTEELYFIHHDYTGYYWEVPKIYEKWNPARPDLVQEWSTPQLIIHSNKDYRIPISEGLAAFNVLQLRGVESKFVTFEGENHWVLNPENSLVWHKEVIGWINKYVGLPEPEGLEPERDMEKKEYDDLVLQEPKDRFKETL